MLSAPEKKILTYTAVILPLVFTAYYVYRFGITIPFWDEWEFIPLLEKMHNHTLALSDLWSQHNEHRIFFPKILMLALARFSNWNIFLELCANLVLATFTMLFLLSLLRNTLEIVPPWLKILTSLMIFSMVQWENWSWGWQLEMFMSVLGFVIAIWAANKWQGKSGGLVVVILAAVLSTYSFNTGQLTWPAVLLVMLLQKKWKLKHIIIFILACTAALLLFYYNYSKCRSHSYLFYFLSHPLVYSRYVLTYLGASLAWTSSSAFITALVILALLALAIINLWRFDKQKLSTLAPWLALALYACMAASITGIGRLISGWEQAFVSRYNIISLFLPLSAAVLLWQSSTLNLAVNPKKPVKLHSGKPQKMPTLKLLKNFLFSVAVLSAFVISYAVSYYNGVKMMERRARVNDLAFCLASPQIVYDDLLKKLYPEPAVVRERIKILSDLGIKFKSTVKPAGYTDKPK